MTIPAASSVRIALRRRHRCPLGRHCGTPAQATNARESRFSARPGVSLRPVAASIRILTAPRNSEIAALAQVFDQYRAHYGEPSDDSASKQWIEECLASGRLRAFVAEDGTTIVGFATTMDVPASLRLAHFWHVRDLFVLPTHRRLGIARALLDSIRTAALAAGALRVVLQTEDDNRPAIRLYENSGYTVVNGYCSLMLPLGSRMS
jgi:ribosomal protein S18 acetylase RimI-like enzyme